MTDLSHWDFAEQFKAKEVAELIMGILPEKNTQVFGVMGEEYLFVAKITPVLRRMERAYKGACNTLHAAATWGEDPASSLDLFPMNPVELHSELMVRTRADRGSFGLSLFGFDKEPGSFDSVYFSREEIDRWLKEIGMKSVYQFEQGQTKATQAPSGRWPWGNHHTELLGHLDATARRYWQNYDATDATTAPTIKDVAEWLVNERKLSQKMAESIASMLRPDGLPTGPRK